MVYCTAQNKNWTLISALINLVNSDALSAETITVKFLESGHTYMSADTVHASVEKRMRAKKNVYDFEDFCSCISNSATELVKMTTASLYDIKPLHSQPKIKHTCNLSNMRVMQFRRGENLRFYKQ